MARHETFGRNTAVSRIAHVANNGPERQHSSVSCSQNHYRDAAVRHSRASQTDDREAYLLASFISFTAAMLFFNCSKAESTPAVTFSAWCTTRLCLIKLANSRSSSSLPVPLEWYNSFLVVSEALWSVRVLSPYLSCWVSCQPWSLSAFLHRQRSQPNRQLRSWAVGCSTYRHASEEDLRRFPAPQAFEELVNDVLGHVDLHCLDGRGFGDPRADVAVRSTEESNAPQGKQRGSHGEAVGERCRRGRNRRRNQKYARTLCRSRGTVHGESTQALEQAQGRRRQHGNKQEACCGRHRSPVWRV